jgi:hypothetical protein
VMLLKDSTQALSQRHRTTHELSCWCVAAAMYDLSCRLEAAAMTCGAAAMQFERGP